MNTAEFDTRLRHQHSVSGADAPVAAPAGIPITVLSADPELCDAIRAAAAPQHPVFVATTMEEAAGLGAAGHCGILVTDQALDQQSLVRMSRQMRTYDPATITIAVGSRGDDHALIGLLSSAVVERFMLKPVTPALARLVLRSASSEYQSLRSRKRRSSVAIEPEPADELQCGDPVRVGAKVIPLSRADVPALPEAQTQIAMQPVHMEEMPAQVEEGGSARQSVRKLPLPWIAAGIAALVVGIAVWWTMQQRMPQIDPRQVIATNLDAAAKAFALGHYVDPPESSALQHYGAVLALDPQNAAARQGMGRIADRMIEGVKTGIVEGRLAEAGIALERVRRLDPTNRRLPLLEEELRREQANQLALLKERAPPVEPPVQIAAGRPSHATVSTRRAPNPQKAVSSDAASIDPASINPGSLAQPKPQMLTPRPVDPNDPLALGPPAPIAQERIATNAPAVAGGVAAAGVAMTRAPEEQNPPVLPAAPPEPRLLKVFEPQYPGEARMRNIEGWVDMTLAVDAAGAVTSAKVEGGKNGRMFDRAALTAVRKWRYEPRTLPGPGTTQPVRVRVHFKLEE